MKGERLESVVRQKKPRADGAAMMVEPLESRKLLSADLTAAFAALPAMLPTAGADQVTIELANAGTSTARGPVTVDLFASTDGSVGPKATLLSSIVEPVHIAAGKSLSLPLRFLSPATLPDGSYFLAATVSGSGFASSTIVSSGPVTIVQPFVDLTSQIVKLPGSAVETGRRLSRMTVQVTNQGNVTASGKVAIEVFISVDGQLDETATPVNVSLPRSVHIKPGGSTTLAVYFSALPDVDPGQYYLLAKVNPGRGIVERNVANNLAISVVPVQVVRAPNHHHGWDCYLVIDSDYFPGPDTGDDYGGDNYGGDNFTPPIDTSGNEVAPTTGPSDNPTTQPGNDPSVSTPPPDSSPGATPAPTTAPTDSSSGDTTSDGGGSDFGSANTGGDDSGGSGDSGGDSTDDEI